ncbi:MAG TPA: aldo/keto reductase [Chitinophagaceae bacterium]|jgi:predicted oxidoreductase|nr:aldo/keto reductase [Chitinophagaceae bacterium]
MEKIYLSDSGPKVSPAVYGFYRWHEEAATVTEMERIIHLCLELGINTFDLADVYGAWQAEALFGEVIKSRSVKREDIIIFTKCGLRIPGEPEGNVRIKHIDLSAEHINRSVDKSLRKLNTDHIDIFLLNGFDPVADLEETAVALRQLKEKGKIKNIGVVNFSVFQHQLLSSYLHLPIVTNHIELSLLNTTALENGQFDYIKQRYMRPLASAPLAEGRIATGKDFVATRVRKKLQEIGERYNADVESVAVAWLVKLGALPLIGTTDENRIRNIIKSFGIDLERQDWYALYDASRKD